MHALSATSWAGQTDYWNYVNQSIVNDMVDQGMMALTGTPTVAAAWRTLLPDYQPGQGIAIKVNFNNSLTCNNTSSAIDGIIEPVNAIASGLQRIGVRTEDIWVYDAVRALPDHFVSDGLAGIRYFDGSYQGNCRSPAGFEEQRSDSVGDVHAAGGNAGAVGDAGDGRVGQRAVRDQPADPEEPFVCWGDLGVQEPLGVDQNPNIFHRYIFVRCPEQAPYFSTLYSPLVDLYRNAHVGGKTVLTIGDGLFGCKG